jgi:hypothetical protein
VIELDKQADDLLQKVASAEDELDPNLLREVIPDKQEFIDYVTEREQRNDPSVKWILERLDSIGQQAGTEFSGRKKSRVSILLLRKKIAAAAKKRIQEKDWYLGPSSGPQVCFFESSR